MTILDERAIELRLLGCARGCLGQRRIADADGTNFIHKFDSATRLWGWIAGWLVTIGLTMQNSTRNEAAQPWAQAGVLGVLFAVPALMAIRQSIVIDPDVWWHMKAGLWILLHHAVPHTDPFSAYGADKPWAAYSWLYEIVIVKLFTWLGLQGIVTYTAGMIALITAAVFRMNRRLIPDFTIAVLLTVVPVVCLLPVLTPRSWLFTILFFTYEIDVLMQARLRGNHWELIALPLVFALWANIHVQFVVGLFVMGVALAEAVHTIYLLGRSNIGKTLVTVCPRDERLYFFQRDSKRLRAVFLRTDWAGNTCPLAVI